MLIQDFSFIVGDTQPVNVTVNKNLSGCTIRWFLKNDLNDNDSTYILTKNTTSGIVLTDAQNGKFTFTMSSAETSTLKADFPYYHEVKITDSLGLVTTVLSGTVTGSNGSVSLSYATVDYADAYFDNVLFPEPWTTTNATTKAKALKMATKKIDSLMLIGRKVNPNQPLEFPRSIYSHMNGYCRINSIPSSRFIPPCWIDETEISQNVKEATCEEALSILKNGAQAQKRSELQRQGVTSFSLGSLSESYSSSYGNPNKLLSSTSAQLLARYLGGSRPIL